MLALDARSIASLVQETLHGFLRRGDLAEEHLDGDLLKKDFMLGREHRAHAAFADHLFDAVFAGNDVAGLRECEGARGFGHGKSLEVRLTDGGYPRQGRRGLQV